MSDQNVKRCWWCGDDPEYVAYHDKEWGVPIYDDQKLFELLCLEGAQAGLSWITILRKRGTYRQAFDHFDPIKMVRYDDAKRAELLENKGIVRNKLKVNAFIVNAQKYLEFEQAGDSFSEYLWSFVGGEVKQNALRVRQDIRSSTEESEAMSVALKKRGFKFVGATICYAFMQSAGMVNDHLTDCFRHKELS